MGYWHEPPEDADAPVVISSITKDDEEAGSDSGGAAATLDLDAQLNQALRGKYHRQIFGLRPGVFLVLLVEQSFWDDYVKQLVR